MLGQKIISYGLSFGLIVFVSMNMTEAGMGWGPIGGWLIGVQTVYWANMAE